MCFTLDFTVKKKTAIKQTSGIATIIEIILKQDFWAIKLRSGCGNIREHYMISAECVFRFN